MRVVHDRAEFAAARAGLNQPVGLVPTMGALHAGHVALLNTARELSESVVATIFVNPLQFGPSEDLTTYPRSLADDLARCEQAGVDVVWAPSVADMYPGGTPQVQVDPGPLGAELEGALRPGHFAGVLTVVAKLFGLIDPAVAFFGEKDYQQFVLIKRMAADLEQGVLIAGVPTTREVDGLALSSRNVYLSPDDRVRAVSLSRALFAGRAAASAGADAVLEAARAELGDLDVDYLELRAADLGPAPAHGAARLLVAARVGKPRLIDNVGIEL